MNIRLFPFTGTVEVLNLLLDVGGLITQGPGGNIFFSEGHPNEIGEKEIGEINSTTHVVSQFPVNATSDGPYGPAAGSDGNIWFGYGRNTPLLDNAINSLNPNTGAVSNFPIKTANSAPYAIVADDGNIWVGENGAAHIAELNLTTHGIADFSDVSQGIFPAIFSITVGPDGNLWFTASSDQQTNGQMTQGPDGFGEFNVTTHVTTFIATPGFKPADIISFDGNLWFLGLTIVSPGDTTIHKFNMATRVVTGFPLPGVGASGTNHAAGLASGPDGNLWFLEQGTRNVAEFNPNTHATTEFPIPTLAGAAIPSDMTSGPNGTLWFTVFQSPNSSEIGLVAAPTTVTALHRFGVHDQATSIVLTFSAPLDPSSAQNVSNYTIIGPRGNPIAVDSAVYNATNDTVTIHPHDRLNIHYTYHLTVKGSTPGGETDANGFLIDGAGTGQSGSNYQATVTRQNLVYPSHP
ncbi:MAG: Ig-like domain-containing protein [Isosphaeraceae bacterium]